MANTTHKPVIFLAFANDRDDTVNYLRNLPEEARKIREPLQRARRDGLCEVVEVANATADDIFRVFQDPEYRDRIAVFHYGGHANGYQLLLESASGSPHAADAGGLAAFFGQQRGLDLVFLNGCSTQQQVQGLLDANVSAVIATSRAIDDQVAMQFSKLFYQGLAGGASIRTAYHEAEAAVQTSRGSNTRGLYFGDADQQATKEIATDRWPWELYLRSGSENVANWSLPEAVGDPLFGLPALPPRDLPVSPFCHLNWFDRERAEVFFGRGHQIRELYDLVTSAGTPPIVLFYGQSGVGKSSMLEAGLIPRLEQTCEVRYLRRNQQIGLLETLRSAFLEARTNVSITQSMHFAQDWLEAERQLGQPLVIILDQIEEVVTRPNPSVPQEAADFLNELEAIFGKRSQRPAGRLILGFRKEWLAEIEARLAEHKLPRAKVFLERLGRLGVMEAVQGPARSPRLRDQYGLTVEEGLAEMIADDLLADAESAIAPTLQILLTKIWDKATDADSEHPHFSKQLYLSLKREGLLLRDFLDQQIAEFRRKFPEAVDSGLLLDIVALHTTPLGTADQRTIEQLQQQYAHLGTKLPELIQQCQDLYLLTVAANAQKASPRTTRLSHDTLAPLVREQFDVSDKPGQRARRILDNRTIDWAGDREGTPLDEADLKIVEQGVGGTRALSPTEQRLLAASRQLQAKLQRTRKLLKFAGATAVMLIVIAALVAVQQRSVAVTAREKAQNALVTGKTAVDEMLMNVGREDLKDVPQMESIREKLLSKAAKFYAEFEQQDPGDPNWQKEIAVADMHVGDLHRALGKTSDADKAYASSAERFKDLIRRYPSEPSYQQGLANTLNWWGELWRRGDDHKAASKYKETLPLQESLVANFANHSDHAIYWDELARTHNNLGLIHRSEKHAEAAIAAHTLVIAMLAGEGAVPATFDYGPHLISCHPDVTGPVTLARYFEILHVNQAPRSKSSSRSLAWAYGNRAILRKESKQFELAEKDYQQAIELWQALLKDQSDDREFQLELSKSRNNLANLLITNKRAAEALLINQQLVASVEQLAAATPQIRIELANSYMSRGAILETLSREDRVNQGRLRRDAAQHYEMAFEHFQRLLREDGEKEAYRTLFGMCVCNIATLELALSEGSKSLERTDEPSLSEHNLSLARHVESAAAIARLDALGDRADAKRYERAAWIMSRCVLLAKADQSIPESSRVTFAREYSDLALMLLQRAINKGAKKEELLQDRRYLPLLREVPDGIEKLMAITAPKSP